MLLQESPAIKQGWRATAVRV